MKYSYKKAQIQSKVFMYIFVAIVILLLLVFSYIAIKKARERARELEQKRLEQEIEASLEEIEYGSVEHKKLNVPEGTKEICFIDITKRSEILKSPILKADKYKRMKNIIQSGEKKNIFFFMQQEPYLTSTYQPGICFDHYPYFVCIEARANVLNLYIEGKGSCALIVMEYKICESMKGKYGSDGKTTNQEISFGSIYAKLTIPTETTLEPAPEEICIEATSYIGTTGLISEVYNITPEHIISNKDVEFDLKYEDFLLPPNTDPGQIKLKRSSSPWELFPFYTVDPDNSRIFGDTKKLSYVAVFGPEPPTAKMSVNGGDLIPDVLPEGTEVIVPKESVVNFNGSESTDPDGKIDIISYEWDFGDETTGTGKTTTHTYAELGSYNMSLKVTDSTGYEDTVKIILTVVNQGNEKEDPDGAIIIISNPTTNWRNILKLVPVAMWKDIDGDQRIPYFVYHKEVDPIHLSIADFKLTDLRSNVGANNIHLFTDESIIRNEQDVSLKSPDTDYFSYWKSYEDIVVVDYDNEDDALMASLFAAFINAPIIFINDANIADYDTALNELALKHAYIIGTLETATDNHIKLRTDTQTYYTSTDLKNPTKNQYQRLSSRIALTTS